MLRYDYFLNTAELWLPYSHCCVMTTFSMMLLYVSFFHAAVLWLLFKRYCATSTFSMMLHFSHAAVACQLFHAAPPPPPPPPDDNFKIRAYMYNFTILHIMYMYIYHFLVSWNGREFDYWHTNRVGSVHSAAQTFYVTPTSQRACALAFMSPFSTVSVFYVTPALPLHIQINQSM